MDAFKMEEETRSRDKATKDRDDQPEPRSATGCQSQHQRDGQPAERDRGLASGDIDLKTSVTLARLREAVSDRRKREQGDRCQEDGQGDTGPDDDGADQSKASM